MPAREEKRREDIFWFRQLASEFNKAKLDEVFGSNRFDCILGFVNNEIMDLSSSSSSVSQGVDWNFIKMSRIKDKDYDMSALHLFSFNFHLRNEKISAKELDKYSKCNCETHSTPPLKKRRRRAWQMSQPKFIVWSSTLKLNERLRRIAACILR